MSPWTEHHSDLITMHKLNDGKHIMFARVEFSPPTMDTAHLIEGYKLKIDEARTPAWFSDDMKEDVADKMRTYVKAMIVTGDVQLLIGGQFIIAPGAKVEYAKAMVINAICGGTVSEIRGGTVSEIRGGTVSAIWGGTVSAIWGGTVSVICGGTVSAIREYFSGLIGPIHKDAKVTDNRPKPKPAAKKPAKKAAKKKARAAK